MADNQLPILVDRTTALTIDAALAYLLRTSKTDVGTVLRSAYVPFWTANEAVFAGDVRMAPNGTTIRRKADGTARPIYDATEIALWTIVSSGGGGSSSATDLTSGTLDYARLPAGTTLTVLKSGSTWPARPTSRTDLIVAWRGPDPSPPIVASGTGGMLDNVDYRLVTP